MQFIDAETRRQLGFDQIWSRIRPVSSLGRKRMRQASAFGKGQIAELEQELKRLEHICAWLQEDPRAADSLSFLLGTVRDIGGSIDRSLQGAVLDDTEFYEIKKLLAAVEKIQGELARLKWDILLPEPLEQCPACREALSIGQGGRDSFYIADDYDEQLAEARKERIRLENVLARCRESADSKLIQAVGRTLSMDGKISLSTAETEKIERVQEIAELAKVQETEDIVTFQLVETEQMRNAGQALHKAREEEERLKEHVRKGLSQTVAEHGPRLKRILEQLAYLDFLLAKAKFSAEINGVRPKLCTDSALRIDSGRHLLVEEEVRETGRKYTPLSLEIASGVTLITGPNMGGKTASLGTIGLLAAMAQYGLLVPAGSMEFSPRDFITAHLATAEIPKGLSSFAGEVAFLRDAAERSDADGLILVDEIAHGTSPAEGAAVAQAVIEYLTHKQTITVITTHFPALAGVPGVYHLRVRGLDKSKLTSVEADALQRCMDYRLEEAGPERVQGSDAVLVAEALGLNESVVRRARELFASGSNAEMGESIDE